MPKLPLVGDVPKGWVIAVGAVSVGALGYVYWRRRQSNTAAAAGSSSSNAVDSSAGLDPSIDPATGIPYSEELAAADGSFGGYAAGGQLAPAVDGGTGLSGPGAFTSNAQWAQYAEAQLAGVLDPTALSAALGRYLTGGAAATDQVSMIDQAIAVAGYPPTSGPNGFPPNIQQQPAGSGSGSGSGGGATRTITVPKAETLAQLAHANHWTAATYTAVQSLNHLSPGSHLKKGQALLRPA